ncbi:MAG: hypothetical protein EOO27_02895 [Comamonadaceae bacterium]|nr:MAG: hypothetical protein EOO27_02895 [Comamonadaceae bacterium]
MYRVEVQIGEDTFPAFEAPALDAAAPPDAEGTVNQKRVDEFFDAIAIHVNRGELVLIPPPPSGFTYHSQALIYSVGDNCAAAAIGMLNGCESVWQPPLLLSSRETIRYVAASAPSVGNRSIIETRRTLKDFFQYIDLWRGPFTNSDSPPERAISDMNKFVGIGHLVGDLHKDRRLWWDCHIEQFGYCPERFPKTGWCMFDLNEHVTPVYRQPTPAQSASNLRPLLSELNSRTYAYLRFGYLEGRGAEGQRVFDLIECGDLTGWMQAIRDNQADLARDRLAEHIACEQELSRNGRHLALTIAALHLSHAGMHTDASTVYEELLGRCESTSTEEYRWTRFNWSQARRRAGDLSASRRGFEEVVALESATSLDPNLEQAAVALLQRVISDSAAD